MLGKITNLTVPAVTAASSSNTDSSRVGLARVSPEGNFSVTIVITDTGTATISYKVALEPGGTYTAPVNGSVIATGLTAGTHVYPFSPVLSKNLKFNIAETVGSNPVIAQITLTVS